MKRAEYCSVLHKARNLKRWAIFLVPLCFCGCFDSQAARTQQARGKGIAAINRFFPFSSNQPDQTADAAASAAEFLRSMPQGISANSDLVQEAEQFEIALPSFFGSSKGTADNPFRAGNASGSNSAIANRGRVSSNGNAAVSILNSSSFSQLFASVFKQNKAEESSSAAKEDLPNPFTEARLRKEASASETTESKPESATKAPEKVQDAPKPQSADASPSTASAGVPIQDQFLIIGDFDGTGRLSTLEAARSGDTVFISKDGERGFTLYANFAALEQQSAFYVDDINGDGNTDLLVTTRTALFGGVLLGDGNGGYRLADRFLTKYQPVVPSAGPLRSGWRDILALDTHSGILTAFVPADHYRAAQTITLSFMPDYLLHMLAPDGSREFVRAAQAGGTEQIFSWGDNDVLQPLSDTLGADPTVYSGQFKSSSLQVYQVGNYASVVLSSQGTSFNVANMRVAPKTFLVLGDLYRQGFVDVAVGSISYFTPKK